MNPNLQRIADAVEAAGTKTPAVVIDAFLPELPEVFGLKLHKFRLGSYLALEKLGHAFVLASVGQQVQVTHWDFATALYVMATPSVEVFAAIEAGTVKAAILEVADRAELADFEEGTQTLLDHINQAMSPMMPMKSATGGQKKTADSAGP